MSHTYWTRSPEAKLFTEMCLSARLEFVPAGGALHRAGDQTQDSLNQTRKGKKKISKVQKKKLTVFIGDYRQAAGGQRSPLAVCTTADLLSSIQLETVHAGEVEAVPHPERLSGGAEGVGHRRAGAGGLPHWTPPKNRRMFISLISE